MRALVAVPLVLILVVGGAWIVYAAAGWNVPAHEILIAAATCLISGELAMAPLLLSGRDSQLAVSQAALVGTMVQLLAGVALAAVVILGKFPLGTSFIYWLMALYWVTLAVVVVVYVRALKSAPAAPSAAKP